MNIQNIITQVDAINALTDCEYVVTGFLETEEDFRQHYREVVSVDESGSAILSEEGATLSITWSQVEAKYNELVAAQPLKLLRQERDRLIAETDWWVVPDRTPTQEQLDYRQALRDITNSYSSLDDVVWPEKP